jgi:hypothetical protein
MRRPFGACLLATVACALAGNARSQCEYWDPSPALSYSVNFMESACVLDDATGHYLCVTHDDSVGIWNGAWVSGGGFDLPVACVGTFDDGSGAALYAGGDFSHDSSGYTSYFHIAKLQNSAWVQVGGGLPALLYPDPQVWVMQTFDDGSGPKLYVGGFFQSNPNAGITPDSDGLVAWDGTTWSGVGGGLTPVAGQSTPSADSLCVFDDGSGPALYVIGTFSAAGGVPANGFAKWDGTNWTSLGSGFTYQGFPAPWRPTMIVFDDGTGPALYVGGQFDHVNGVAAEGIARWNGTSWSPLPGIPPNSHLAPRCMTVHQDGTGSSLYLASWAQIGPVWTQVVKWDGHGLSGLGGGVISGNAWMVQSFDDGQGGGPAVYVGGIGLSGFGGNVPGHNIARWYGDCTHRIDPLCFGDGTFAPCPCANFGASEHGCANSASSQGALLSHSGSLVPDTLALTSSIEPSTSLSIFVQSDELRPLRTLVGDGILCLGGTLRRMYVKNAVGGSAQAPATGDPSITQRSAAIGDPLTPGSVRYYQVWYRDDAGGFCTANTFNISNGLRVVW